MLQLLLCGSAITACGDDDDSSASPETLGDVCFDTASVWCDRALACLPDGDTTETACVNDFVAACCLEDGACRNQARQISEAEWQACLQGYDDLACDSIVAGDLPLACLEI